MGYSEQTGCTLIVVSSHVAGVCLCVCARLCLCGSLLKRVSSLNSHLVVFPQNQKLDFYLSAFPFLTVSNVKKWSFSQPDEKLNGLKSHVGRRGNTGLHSLQGIFLFSPFIPRADPLTKPNLTFFLCLSPVKMFGSRFPVILLP